MSDCCSSSSESKPKTSKLDCPACGEKCLNVSLKAMLHHIKQPWTYEFSAEQYYYCDHADCDVAYFSNTDEIIYEPDIRDNQHDTDQINDPLVCFCFGARKSETSTNKAIKNFVVQQTKVSMCSCETANPSGRCCLKDFPKFK